MHFCVLVVTDERPDEQIIQRELLPFRQDALPRFLEDVDVTESAQERFLMASGTMLRDPDGNLHDGFSEEFYREPTEEEDKAIVEASDMDGANRGVRFRIKGWSDGVLAPKVRFVPQGWEETANPSGHNQTFADYVSDYYAVPLLQPGEDIDLECDHSEGHVLVDASGDVIRVITRRNRKSRYDYFDRPGRFAGALNHLRGRDVCQRRDLKLEPAAAKHAQSRREWAEALVAKTGVESLSRLRELLIEMSVARNEWLQEKSEKGSFREFLLRKGRDDLEGILSAEQTLPDVRRHASLEDWFSCSKPLPAYAIVADGIWHEAARSPWWRDMSLDDEKWATEGWKILEALSDEKWLTVVDCHN